MCCKFILYSLIILINVHCVSGRVNIIIKNPADTILPVVRCNDFMITGDGSHTEWEKAHWIRLSRLNGTSAYQTLFKIMYSDSGIYCLFACSDNLITATLKGDNLDLFTEDVIEAFFWTDETVPVYFEYELSPLNYELILMVPNYNGRFLGWIPWHYTGNRKTHHKVSLQQDDKNLIQGWTGEFYIPFELMKPMVGYHPKSGATWRANFYRIDYDTHSVEWSWLPIVNNFHDYPLFGTLLFE